MKTKNKNLGYVLNLDLTDKKDLYDFGYSVFIDKFTSEESMSYGSVRNRIIAHELYFPEFYGNDIALKYSLDDEDVDEDVDEDEYKEKHINYLYLVFSKDLEKKRLNCDVVFNLKQKRKILKEPFLFISGLALSFLEAMKISKNETIGLNVDKRGEPLILQMKEKLPFMRSVRAQEGRKKFIVKKEKLEKFIKENKITQKEKNITNFELSFKFKNE